jgi:signal transduction histidine kinase
VIFRRAILRLTIAFSVVQLLVFGAFAVAVYFFVTASFDLDAAESDGATVNAAEQGFSALRTGLALGFLALLIVVPVISCLMAARVLRPIRSSYEAQQRFVDDASHEFRTPLSVLQGGLELALSRPRVAPEYVRTLERALAEVGSLDAMTSDLLLLARGGFAVTEAGFEPVDLVEVVDQAILQATEARRPHAEIERIIESAPTVIGSRTLLARAVANLLDNAIKFTPLSGTITVHLADRVSLAMIEIRDTGTGLPPRSESKAFERFWRAEESRTLPGHGLGLALVQQIARAHGGRAAIMNDTSGSGVIASIELPRIRERG